MKNMSWGNKIVIVFAIFVSGMFLFLYKAFNTKFDLVTKDYYKEELRYQDKIDGIANANKLADLVIVQDEASVYIQFPKELQAQKITGEIWFYCKTDANKDARFPIKLDENGRQIIAKTSLFKQNFEVKCSWQADGKLYFSEKLFQVQ